MKENGKILSFKAALVYSLGIFGIQMLIGYVNNYQSQFYTSVLDANLAICAIIILLAKILSCIADPLIGSLIDRSHFKGGKMRPFVAISILPLAILTTMLFINIRFPNDLLKYLYITFTTVLWNISMSLADIPSQGLLSLLSPDSDEKSAAAGVSNTLKSIALVVPNVLIPVACALVGSAAITPQVYVVTGVLVSVLALGLVGLMLAKTKEVVPSIPVDTSFGAMFRELKTNRMLLLNFLIFMVGCGRQIAVNIGVQTAAMLFDAVHLNLGFTTIDLAGENLSILLGVGSAGSSMLGMVLAPIINKKIGTKKTFLLFAIYGTIVSIAAYLLFVFGGAAFRTPLAVILSQFFIGFMFGATNYSPLVMLTDTVDYQEMKTGKRTEGVQYAVLSLSVKLSTAFAVAMGVFMIGISGYKGTMTYADITPKMQNITMTAYWLIPGISSALSCIPMLFYVIDGKVRDEVRAFIAAKATAGAQPEKETI